MKFFRILDPFTLTLVTVVLLASFFPARGGFVPFFEHLTTAAIALLFFMHGAKLSREAIIAGGGMVGGLGERYTRVAAAHAVHNGLTVLPQTDKFLHGTKVAYGILVQSALLGQDEVLAQLVQAYQRFNLPTTLAALEVDINNRTELDRVIAHTLRPVESIHFLPVELNGETLRAAFEKVERFAS